jgi:hypothetical protein
LRFCGVKIPDSGIYPHIFQDSLTNSDELLEDS